MVTLGEATPSKIVASASKLKSDNSGTNTNSSKEREVEGSGSSLHALPSCPIFPLVWTLSGGVLGLSTVI